MNRAARNGGRTAIAALLGVVLFVLLWEGYKLVGSPDGTVLFGVRILPRADDLSMPHLYDVVKRLGRPELAGGRPVWIVVLHASAFTLGITAVGFAVGALVGLLLAVLMQRFRIVERGLLPYVILSQTVPLVALAPLVAGWSGNLSFGPYPWQDWMTVSLIAAYLAFFPVAVGMLRGLQSPPAAGVELMRSYAAGWWRTLIKLRFPAALPYLFPALRLAGAAAVVAPSSARSPPVRGAESAASSSSTRARPPRIPRRSTPRCSVRRSSAWSSPGSWGCSNCR
jgi:NitT/TauT family transport system permease protein